MLIAGIDDNPKLFVTDPAGIYFQYKATAIGESEMEIKTILEDEYKDEIKKNWPENLREFLINRLIELKELPSEYKSG